MYLPAKGVEMKLGKQISIAISLVLALCFLCFSYLYISGLSRLGELSRIFPRFDGVCKDINTAYPAEDLLNLNGKIYFTQKGDNGGIGILDPLSNSKNYSEYKFNGTNLGHFDNLIFAVNKPKSQIEVFNSELKHLKTINLNGYNISDIVPISENSFYFTEDTKLKSGLLTTINIILFNNDNSGALYFYDNGKIEKQAEGLKYANSIALSNDKSKLYLSATLEQAIYIYNRAPNNKLILKEKVEIGTGLHNINIDEEDRLWIGAYPKILTTILYNGKNKIPPSQVIILEPNREGNGGLIDQVYLMHDNFGAATSAIKNQNNLYIGSAVETKLRVCELPKIWHQSKAHPASKLINTQRDIERKEAIKKARGF